VGGGAEMAQGVGGAGLRGGAGPEPGTADAGVLLPPGDLDALAATLRGLMENPAEREGLAAGARAAAAGFPSWADSAKLFAQVLDILPLAVSRPNGWRCA